MNTATNMTIGEVRRRIQALLQEHGKLARQIRMAIQALDIDAEIELQEMAEEVRREINMLEPFTHPDLYLVVDNTNPYKKDK